jgi:biotin carboxylase
VLMTANTVLFISSSYKGVPMIEAVKKAGLHVLLLVDDETSRENWPFESIDEFFVTPSLARYQDVINTVAYLCRGRQIDYIAPLDEFEIELVAILREHLRLPGMGVSAMRKMRDKLTMRDMAQAAGIKVPAFIQIKNYDKLREYMEAVPPPWVLKPRMEAGSMGIKKVQSSEEVWRSLDELGDKQSYFLLEHFIPGDVFHVDSIIQDGKVIFVSVAKYGAPPMSVYQGGGVFRSRLIPRKKGDAPKLRKLNEDVLKALGMEYGVAHTEFIKAHDSGEYYFLETAARVGGAHISDLIEQATNVNLWHEWGRMIVAQLCGERYQLPETKELYGGLMMSLAKQEHPDMSAYNDAEIVWKANKAYHAGLICVSEEYERIEALLEEYTGRFLTDFTTSAPPMGVQRTGQSG